MRHPLSLRTRLVLGLLVLAAVGLVVADVATYKSQESFLFQQTDQTLQNEHQFGDRAGGPDGGSGGPGGQLPPELYVEVRSLSTGKVLEQLGPEAFPGAKAGAPPRLPATITLTAPTRGQPDAVRYFTAPAASGGGRYRVRASIDPGRRDQLLIVATPLHDVDAALHRLFLIELFVTLAVLAALVGLALWVVRIGLKPLVEIEHTAAAIAAGDLSKRVERAEPTTEVGRLGLALNAMLARIEESDLRLRRFVADASHELRTPLAAVRAYAELFKRGASTRPDDLERAMSGIGRESERMSLLVDDLLLLARLDEGRPLEQEQVDLGQVVDNLLANARSHTPAGTPVHVRVSRNGANAVVEVEDEGPGIPAAEIAQVFERFHRADPSRARSSGGVGLGLSIVSAVAEAHGGSASATSEPGHGATFRITLPLSSP